MDAFDSDDLNFARFVVRLRSLSLKPLFKVHDTITVFTFGGNSSSGSMFGSRVDRAAVTCLSPDQLVSGRSGFKFHEPGRTIVAALLFCIDWSGHTIRTIRRISIIRVRPRPDTDSQLPLRSAST